MEASALQAPVGLARISLSAPLLKLRSDEQLVALFRAGNEEAFRVIHDRYAQRLFAYARQMLSGSRQDAEDALQDVFIRAHGALRASDRPVALRAWLYRVAHNRCVDELRRPLPPAADVLDVTRRPQPDPLAEVERRDDLRRLVDDVRRLPAQQRSALLMRELEGLAYADLATALEVTVPAVKSLLVRARMGLVEAAEARDTACVEIRGDLAMAHGCGVRATGRARRHLRDCEGCRRYRSEMRRVQRTFSALTPAAAGPLGLLAKLGLGGGGAGGGATAGGGALAGGGAAASGTAAAGGTIAGSAGAALTATKVAAVVSAVVVAGGGAVKVEQRLAHHAKERVTPAVIAPAALRAPAPELREQAARAVEAPAKAKPAPAIPFEEPVPDAAPALLPADPTSRAEDTGDESEATGSGGLAAPEDSAQEIAPSATAPTAGRETPDPRLASPVPTQRSGIPAAPGTGTASGSTASGGSGTAGAGS